MTGVCLQGLCGVGAGEGCPQPEVHHCLTGQRLHQGTARLAVAPEGATPRCWRLQGRKGLLLPVSLDRQQQ